MSSDIKTEDGITFRLQDYSDIGLTAKNCFYHFKNLGGKHGVWDYVDCYHLVEAIVSAPSHNEAIKLMLNELLSSAEEGYTYDVELIGIDGMSDVGNRLIMHFTKPPLD